VKTKARRADTAVIEFRDHSVDHVVTSGGHGSHVYREHFGRTVVIAPIYTPIQDIAKHDLGYLTMVKADTMSGRIEIVASLKNTPEIRKALGLSVKHADAVASVTKDTIVKHVLPRRRR
jgi:hypothetical protein